MCASLDDAPIAGRRARSSCRASDSWRTRASCRRAMRRSACSGRTTGGSRNSSHGSSELSLIALVFPKFRDGRAYSQARLLRERYGLSRRIARDRRRAARPIPISPARRLRCIRGEEARRMRTYLRKAAARFSVFYQPSADGRAAGAAPAIAAGRGPAPTLPVGEMALASASLQGVAKQSGWTAIASLAMTALLLRSVPRSASEDMMAPVVAVIAPGAMGAAVGRRLTDHGVKVLTSLTGRSRETAARAREAGMIASERRGNRCRRFHPFDPAARRRACACRTFCAGVEGKQRQAGLCRLQCHQSGDRRACRGGYRADRMPVRRCGIIGPPPPPTLPGKRRRAGCCRPAILRFRRGGAALRRVAPIRPRHSRAGGPLSAASALKMSYAGITKGTQAIGAAMMLAATRAGSAEALFEELPPARRKCWPCSSSNCRGCRKKPTDGSRKCRKSPASSARILPRASFIKAPRIFMQRIAEDFAADKKDVAALLAFLNKDVPSS